MAGQLADRSMSSPIFLKSTEMSAHKEGNLCQLRDPRRFAQSKQCESVWYCRLTVCLTVEGIRLAGSNGSCAGRVEVKLKERWGTLCDEHWSIDQASVVCRQLGCGRAVSAPKEACFGEGRGPIWRDFECHNNEVALKDCTIKIATQECHHGEDAGVICSDFPKGTEWKCEEPLPGTTISIDPDHVRLGESVSITCSIPTQHQSGTFILDQKDGPFQESKKVRGTSATFTISSVDYKYEGAYRCVYETTGSYGHTVRNRRGQHATLSVDDDGMNVQLPILDSADVEVRLGDRDDHCTGRVELKHKGRWGTLCDDNWTIREANVVCRQLGCGRAVGISTKACFGNGRGPIWRDFDCHGTEKSLKDCTIRKAKAVCDHDEDAGVICSGAALTAPVLTIIPSKSNFDVGEDLRIVCKISLPVCAEAKFRMYRNGHLYTSMENDHTSLGFVHSTSTETGNAGDYSCDYIYTTGNVLQSPKSNTVNIAVTKYILGFIPSTYT